MECNLAQNMSGMIDTQFTNEYFIDLCAVNPAEAANVPRYQEPWVD